MMAKATATDNSQTVTPETHRRGATVELRVDRSAPGALHRWGSERPILAFAGFDAGSGEEVGFIRLVSDPDPLAGLVAWVYVHPHHRHRGYGLAMHRSAVAVVGRLLLDTSALGTHRAYDGVSPDEMRVWDSMVRSPDWYVFFAAAGAVLCAVPSSAEAVR